MLAERYIEACVRDRKTWARAAAQRDDDQPADGGVMVCVKHPQGTTRSVIVRSPWTMKWDTSTRRAGSDRERDVLLVALERKLKRVGWEAPRGGTPPRVHREPKQPTSGEAHLTTQRKPNQSKQQSMETATPSSALPQTVDQTSSNLNNWTAFLRLSERFFDHETLCRRGIAREQHRQRQDLTQWLKGSLLSSLEEEEYQCRTHTVLEPYIMTIIQMRENFETQVESLAGCSYKNFIQLHSEVVEKEHRARQRILQGEAKERRSLTQEFYLTSYKKIEQKIHFWKGREKRLSRYIGK